MQYLEFLEHLNGRVWFEGPEFSHLASKYQLHRWTTCGYLLRLRRGFYCLADTEQDLFELANALVPGSYVSGLSALAYHQMVKWPPERVESVVPGRWLELDTPLGGFLYRKAGPREALGDVVNGVASPERALFDLLRLTPHSQELGFLGSLGLRQLFRVNYELFVEARRGRKPKMSMALARLINLCKTARRREEALWKGTAKQRHRAAKQMKWDRRRPRVKAASIPVTRPPSLVL